MFAQLLIHLVPLWMWRSSRGQRYQTTQRLIQPLYAYFSMVSCWMRQPFCPILAIPLIIFVHYLPLPRYLLKYLQSEDVQMPHNRYPTSDCIFSPCVCIAPYANRCIETRAGTGLVHSASDPGSFRNVTPFFSSWVAFTFKLGVQLFQLRCYALVRYLTFTLCYWPFRFMLLERIDFVWNSRVLWFPLNVLHNLPEICCAIPKLFYRNEMRTPRKPPDRAVPILLYENMAH